MVVVQENSVFGTLNQIAHFCCNVRTNLNLSDMECGYKFLKKSN